MLPAALWILFSAWLVATGWFLSLLGELNAGGYLLSLALFTALGFVVVLRKGKGAGFSIFRAGGPRRLWRRFRRPIPLIYLIYLLAALIGGSLHAPANYDGICYRIPRILHWWHEGHWLWIGGWNVRMDISATGFEWLMLPILGLLKTDRLLFLINLLSYALLPGLIYSSFTRLGIAKRVAWYWMWLLPCAYCFVLQAGSIGNDTYAAVYFLAAIAFALRSAKRGSWPDAAFTLLSAALLTGAKASNLPLLLPLLFLIAPLWRILLSRPFASLGVLALASVISFLPVAVSNSIHTGDWSGDPQNKESMKLKNPVAGVVGNSLQMGVGAIAPPLFPVAKTWNAKAAALLTHGPLHSIQKGFPRLNLGLGELPDEEASGLGIGIGLLLLISLGAALAWKGAQVTSSHAALFGILCWIALAAYMAKLGSECTPRLVSAYYPGLIIPVLALRGQALLVRRIWWTRLALLSQLVILPALLLNPARPLLPVQSLIQTAERHGLHGPALGRLETVYSVYQHRSDQLALVREHLPPGVKVIGFSGTADESEYSFWRGLKQGRVIDLQAVSADDPWKEGLDCIVGSEWGIHDRFHVSAEEYAARIGGFILWSGGVRAFAGREPVSWYVIAPKLK